MQEYYIRHKDGRTVDTHAERQKVTRSLRSAVERRGTHVSRLYQFFSTCFLSPPPFADKCRRFLQGLKVELRANDRSGLLSDFTKVLREHGLSLLRIELKRYKDEAFGVFYLVTDAGGEVRAEAVRPVQATLQAMDISLDVVKEAPACPPVRKTSVPAPPVAGQVQERARPSLGSLLWSRLGKLSDNFGHIISS
jgi:UTP:GlnB (protein PII) uridylyltransferase